jgi:hypothetical protein
MTPPEHGSPSLYADRARVAGNDGKQTIARIRAPTGLQFRECFAEQSRPVIIEGVVQQWRCYQRWTDAYLIERLRGRKFLVNSTGGGLFGIFSSRMGDADSVALMSLAEFFEHVRAGAEDLDAPIHYIQQKPIGATFPELIGDVEYAEFVNPSLVTQLNLWISQHGSRIPLHFDTYDNLLVQVRGAKSVKLFGPWRTPYLYPGRDGAEFASNVDPENPDYDTYPLFRNVGSDFDFLLNEGEMLYLPPFWWHSIISETNVCISINYWYDLVLGASRTPFASARDLLRLGFGSLDRLPIAQKLQVAREVRYWLDAIEPVGATPVILPLIL